MQLFDAINQFYFNMTISDLQMLNRQVLNQSISYHSLLYLDLISYKKNCTVSDLAKILGVSLPAVTSKVNELIRQGYVAKTQSEKDRRVNFLALDESIKPFFTGYDRRMLGAIGTVKEHFSQEQIDCFCEILRLISRRYMEEQQNEYPGAQA